MKKLDELRNLIEKGKFPNDYPEFGGADLIITSNRDRDYFEGDTVVYSEHAPALSWLVVELKNIYISELNYLNKYDFYPSIGKIINQTLTKQELLIDVMLYIVDEIEREWGSK